MNVYKTLLLTFVFHLALGACQNETGAPPADAIYHGGEIYTLDDKRSWAEAVAVKDGRFLATGNSADMLALAGADTEKYNLNGAMALPGLHDAHFHYLSVTNALDCTPGQFKPEQLKETLQYCKSRLIEGYPWVLINGMEMWGDSPLSNDLLNEAFPDTPVLIRDVTMHTRLVNARALEIAGIDRDTEPPETARCASGWMPSKLSGKPTVTAVSGMKSDTRRTSLKPTFHDLPSSTRLRKCLPISGAGAA